MNYLTKLTCSVVLLKISVLMTQAFKVGHIVEVRGGGVLNKFKLFLPCPNLGQSTFSYLVI